MMEQSGEPLLPVFPCSLPHTMQSLGHPFPALGRTSVRFHDVLLGHGPSLHHLRRRCFHRPCSAASLVVCPCSTPRRCTCLDCAFGFPGRSRSRVGRRIPVRSLGSRACSFSTCVRLLDYAGPDEDSRYRFRQCGLPVRSTRSAPGMRFSKLDSSPVDASVYTSPGTSRHPAQDMRSRWFATPFLWGSFIPDYTPVYPDDCTPLRSRFCKHAIHATTRDTPNRAATVRGGFSRWTRQDRGGVRGV